MASDFKEFSIDSTLELVADHFQAATIGSELFRQATPADRIDLTLGLFDGTQSKTISQIRMGVIDEYELTITPTSITGNIRGRDPSALILDRYFKKRYIRLPAPTVVSKVVPVLGAIPEVQGRFFASTIAAEVVASVGLTLSYETTDYELLDTFEAVGRVVDILRNLIQPWTLVEPFRTDIFLIGTTLILRQRQFPILNPDYVINLTDVRRNQVTMRRRATKKVGILTLRGARVADALVPNPDNAVTGGFLNIFLSPDTSDAVETDFMENFSPSGVLQSTIFTITTYQQPQHIMLTQVKTEFTRDANGLIMKSREKIKNTWDDVAFDNSGAQSQPKQTRSLIARERIDDSDKLKRFMLWDTEAIGYAYDESGFLLSESKVLQTLDLANAVFVNSKMNIKVIKGKGSLLVEQITTDYVWDSGSNSWKFDKRDTQTQGGYPPGGPGRGYPISAAAAGQPAIGGSRQIELITQLSTDPDAQDVEISNTNLSLANLQQILAQFQSAQGLFEYEMSFSGVGMPFIQRGKSIQLIGVTDENGNLMSFPAMMITEANSKFGVSTYTIDARAFGWRAS